MRRQAAALVRAVGEHVIGKEPIWTLSQACMRSRVQFPFGCRAGNNNGKSTCTTTPPNSFF